MLTPESGTTDHFRTALNKFSGLALSGAGLYGSSNFKTKHCFVLPPVSVHIPEQVMCILATAIIGGHVTHYV